MIQLDINIPDPDLIKLQTYLAERWHRLDFAPSDITHFAAHRHISCSDRELK